MRPYTLLFAFRSVLTHAAHRLARFKPYRTHTYTPFSRMEIDNLRKLLSGFTKTSRLENWVGIFFAVGLKSSLKKKTYFHEALNRIIYEIYVVHICGETTFLRRDGWGINIKIVMGKGFTTRQTILKSARAEKERGRISNRAAVSWLW